LYKKFALIFLVALGLMISVKTIYKKREVGKRFNVEKAGFFLKNQMSENGEFFSEMCYKNECKQDHNYFVTISIMLLLTELDKVLFDYGPPINFIKSGMHRNGLWQFWVGRGRAWDIDDTSLASQLLYKKGCFIKNEQLLLSNLNKKGLIKTWIPFSKDKTIESDESDVDIVANSNAFLYIKSEPERTSFCHKVNKLIESQSYEEMILYYPDSLDFYFSISKVHKDKMCISKNSIEHITVNTLRLIKTKDKLSDSSQLAKIILILLNFEVYEKNILCQLIKKISFMQRKDGGFVSGIHFWGPSTCISTPKEYTWKSDALTTAYNLVAFYKTMELFQPLDACFCCENYND